MSRSRRIDWAAAQKRGWFAVMGAMCLVAPLALLVLIGLSPGAMAAAATLSASSTAASPTAAATTPASTPSCFPLTESSGTCYNAGEFCPNADLNMSGVAANGTPIACEPEANGTQPHWRDCTPAASTATPASTATGTLVCPAARAGAATTPSTSASATTGTTASATPEVSHGCSGWPAGDRWRHRAGDQRGAGCRWVRRHSRGGRARLPFPSAPDYRLTMTSIGPAMAGGQPVTGRARDRRARRDGRLPGPSRSPAAR